MAAVGSHTVDSNAVDSYAVDSYAVDSYAVDLYAVIGNPIAQSKSPFIHDLFARATGQAMQYQTLLCEPTQFKQQVDQWVASGAKGLNITAPFKLDAFAYAHQLSDAARSAGAVNAMKFVDGVVYGENFDGIGLVNDVTLNLQNNLDGKRVLILGSGGAVRGALQPILKANPARVVIACRKLDSARGLIDANQSIGQVELTEYQHLVGRHFDIVFNATSSSLFAQLPPIQSDIFSHCQLAYDLSYGKGLTPFLAMAKAMQVTNIADGVGMLVEQAAFAFDWWRGVRPETKAAIAALTVPLD